MVAPPVIIAGALTCFGAGFYMGYVTFGDAQANLSTLENELQATKRDAQAEVERAKQERSLDPIIIHRVDGKRHQTHRIGGPKAYRGPIAVEGLGEHDIARALVRACELEFETTPDMFGVPRKQYFSRANIVSTGILTRTQFDDLCTQLANTGYLMPPEQGKAAQWTAEGRTLIIKCHRAHPEYRTI